MISFKLFLNESNIIHIKSYEFLINPSAKELALFLKKNKTFSNADFDLRGLYDGQDIYWFSASLLTHDFAAKILKIDYRKSSRLTAYINSYKEIVVDYPIELENNPILKKLNLDYDGVLNVQL